ncbi:MAG: acyltransferase, partial [Cyanobacteria bacterium P01_H01_bin.130]
MTNPTPSVPVPSNSGPTQPMDQKKGHGRRLVELDAIRGLAALAIVFFHYGSSTQWPATHPYHYFQYLEEFVQIFFVLSGFVVLISFTRIKRALDFIVGRFARLYPVYWLSVLVTIAIIYLFKIRPAPTENPVEILLNLSMFQELLGFRNINIVYWTLTLELVFYGIFILLYKLKLLGKIDFILGAWITVIFLDTLKATIAINSA